jgi:Uma2 family endonuclease
MLTATKYSTREEYLALEDVATIKHEFYQGEIFAMSGGTFNHSLIKDNSFYALRSKLKGKSCHPMGSDMRISSPSGLMTYPDVSVFCGRPELTDKQRTLLNPVVIIEVLSPTTRRYDQGEKFLLYRAITTFRDYLLIDSERIHVQHFHRLENNRWILPEYLELTELINIDSIGETLRLAEIYEGIVFTSEE